MARPPNPDASRRLLEAARHVFARDGFDHARIQDIAEEAGYSKAAFYLYFESKEKIFERLMAELFDAVNAMSNERHEAFQALVQRLGRCVEGDFLTGSARLTAFTSLDHEHNRNALMVLWEHRDVFACVMDASGERRLIAERFTELSRASLAVRIDEVVKAGFLRPDLDPELCAEMMIGAWMQLARRMARMKEPPDFEYWTTQIDRFTSEGLGCRPGIPVARET